MARRALGALLVVVVMVPAIWAGGAAFAGLSLALSIIGVWELSGMLSRKQIYVSRPIAALSSVFITLSAYSGNATLMLASIGLFTLLSIFLPVVPGRRASFTDAMATVFTVMYVPFLMSHLILLRAAGIWLLALPVACTWATDVFAYLSGMQFGKHKLAPSISPAKSWEGAIGGAIASSLAGYAISLYAPFGATQGLLFGFVLGVFGQIGDLAESALKRFSGIKDSGSIIPGHGGVLDRFDSLLVNGALSFYLVTLVK